MRRIIAILVGFIIGMILVMIAHIVVRNLHPMPADLNIHDREGLLDWKRSIPYKVILIEVSFHIVAGFSAAFLAARITDQNKFYIGLFIGLLFVFSTIANVFSFPHSFWMAVFDVFGVIIFAYLGARIGSGSSSSNTSTL